MKIDKKDRVTLGDSDRHCDGCDEPQGENRWFEIDSKHGLCCRCCDLDWAQMPKQLAGKLGE